MTEDRYANFQELQADTTAEVDYHIESVKRDSPILIMTPHGGGIESGVSELVLYTAAGEFSEYYFEALRTANNRDLHITSSNFDEPIGDKMARESEFTLAYHGYSDTENKHTLIGGRDEQAKHAAYKALTRAGFSAEVLANGTYLAGSEQNNICNRNKRGMGLQLELSTAQRLAFFETNTRAKRRLTTNAEFHRYVEAIRSIYQPIKF